MTQTAEWFVRPARPEDLSRIVEFNLGLARETEDKQLDEDVLRQGVRRLLADPDRGRYRVVEISEDARRAGVREDRRSRPRHDSEGHVVGALMLTVEWSDWRNGWFWWIQSVYVDPEYRGTGVYRALHESVVREARAAGDVCGVRLYVERENDKARRTYEHLGMQASGYLIYATDFGVSGDG